MAKLTVDGTDSVAGDGGLFALLASCGVLFCMISAFMGIKIWWFKHRLSFDHSRTSNGAAGRATPTVPLRTRSNREKRISQEPSEVTCTRSISSLSNSPSKILSIRSVFYCASMELAEDHELKFRFMDNGQLQIHIDKNS